MDKSFDDKQDKELEIPLSFENENGNTPSPRRWFILGMFFIYGFTNNLAWSTYGGITDQSKRYYNCNLNEIVWFTNVFKIFYLACSFFSAAWCEKNFVLSMLFGTLMNGIGGWVRYIAGRNYSLALTGQGFVALSQSFILFTPMIIAQDWFDSPQERFLSITIGSYSTVFGVGVGYILSPAIFRQGGPEENSMKLLLLVEAIAMSVPFFICCLVIKGRPQKKVGFNLAVLEQKKLNFFQNSLLLLKNVKFSLALLCFALAYSNSWGIMALLDSFLEDNGFDHFMIGIIGFIYVMVGILGGFLGTLIIKYVNNSRRFFDPIIKALIILGTIAFIILAIFIENESIIFIGVIVAVLGFGMIAFQPFACESLSELGYPVNDSFSVNMYYWIGGLVGLILTNLASLDALGKNGKWVLVGAQIPAFIYLVLFLKTKFHRSPSGRVFIYVDDVDNSTTPDASGIINHNSITPPSTSRLLD